MERQDERDKYLETLFDNLFFSQWKEGSDNPIRKNIEFQVTYTCNLSCKYCYVNRHGNDLYPKEIRDKDKIIENLKKVIDWIDINKYKIKNWNIFSGSFFSQEIGFMFMDAMYDKLKKVKNKEIYPKVISIPTNLTFILDDETTKKVENIIEKFKKIGIRVHLSCSVEGKYMEQNRPFKGNLELGNEEGKHLFVPKEKEPRDDEYYEKVFQFVSKWGYGFHPMIYSKDINKWKENFIWFQKMFKKYNINHDSIFLLEVRNVEWSNKQLRDLKEFIKFVYKWVFENIADRKKEKMVQLLENRDTINLIYSPLGSKRNKGMPCSIQSDMQIRMGDLHLVPCHRASYNGYEYGKFKTTEGSITGLEAINVEMATSIYSLNHESFPHCMTCPIKSICNKSCLGANMETEGDPFTVNPKVCQLNNTKVSAVAEALVDLGIFYKVMSRLSNNQKQAFKLLRDEYLGKEGEKDG